MGPMRVGQCEQAIAQAHGCCMGCHSGASCDWGICNGEKVNKEGYTLVPNEQAHQQSRTWANNVQNVVK